MKKFIIQQMNNELSFNYDNCLYKPSSVNIHLKDE